MIQKKNILFLIITLFCSVNVYSQSDQQLIRNGNNDYKEKKYAEAEKKYKASVDKNPKTYAGNFNLGNSLYKQKKYEDAGKQYMQSVGVNEDKSAQAAGYYNLGNAYLKGGKYQESVDAYKMALRMNPKDENARYNLAYALAKLRQQQEQDKKQQKDQKKDKNQKQDKNQQSKDQQNKDQQQKNRDQQQQQKDQQKKEQAKQQKDKPKISKEDAERMLEALKNDEKNLQKKNVKKFEAQGGSPEKDW